MISVPSIQSLFLQMYNDGKYTASGTGFIMLSNSGLPYLITNRHNVTGRNNMTGELLPPYSPPDSINIWHFKNKKIGNNSFEILGGGLRWEPKIELLYKNNGEPVWYEHPTLKEKADFVAVPITNADGFEFNPYKYVPCEIELVPSSIVSIIGFPFGEGAGGRLAIWSTGFVASEIEFNYNGLPIFLVDSRTRQGQSGSPVVCHVNGVIRVKGGNGSAMLSGRTFIYGIYSGRINSESDIGMVWKIQAVEVMMETLP